MARSYGVVAWLAVLAVTGSVTAQTSAPTEAAQTAPATAPASTAPAAPATPEQIKAAVAQLGATTFRGREEAARFLLNVGKEAEAALNTALDSPDTEVRIRAQQLLSDIKMGIGPEVPPAVVALLRQYRATTPPMRNPIILKLAEQGPPGVTALLRLSDQETIVGQRREIMRAILTKGGVKITDALRTGNTALAESLLELGRAVDDFPILRSWLAYQFVNGKADTVIAQLNTPEQLTDGRVLRQLMYLYRLKGDLPKAIQVAERTGDRRITGGLRMEEGNWKAMAEIYEGDKTRGTYGKQAALLVWHYTGDTAKSRAALASLPPVTTPAGMPAGFPGTPSWHFHKPALLLLTDRVDEAIKMLADEENPMLAFETRCLRGQYEEAFASIPPLEQKTLNQRIYLYVSQVRQLSKLGENDKACAILDQLGAQQAARPDGQLTFTLMGIERELGRPEKALERALTVLEKDRRGFLELDRLLESLAGNQGKMWWELLETVDAGMPQAERLKKVDALVRQKVPADELENLVEQIRKHVERNGFRNQDEEEQYGKAIAPALTAAGYRGKWLAEVPRPAPRRSKNSPQPPAPSAPPVVDPALEAATKGQWAQAAELYGEQAKAGANFPALYMQGYCLTQLGQKAEGEKLMHLADVCMLADDPLRYRTADDLEGAGAKELAQRQRQLVMALIDPAINLRPHPGLLDSAAQETDAKRGLMLWEQRMAAMMYSGRMLGPNNSSGEIGTYLEFATQHHRLRARAALQDGNVEGALAAAQAALGVLPTDVDVGLELVPLLDKAKQKAAGDALVGTIADTHERILRNYPRACEVHTALARLCSGTGRRLDLALEHAKKAVELAPTNAEYQDILAETHFVRGEVQQAIELEKKLVAANPGVALYAEQLARFSAATTQPADR